MRRLALLTTLALLPAAAMAQDYDPSKASRYASPPMYRPKVDRLILKGAGGIVCDNPAGCDASTLSVTLPSGSKLTLPDAFAAKMSSINVAAAPSSAGNWGSVDTAFTGDTSKMSMAVRRKITGSTTAGNPSTGYVLKHELGGIVQYLQTGPEVGTNASPSTNDGRTGVPLNVGVVSHYGNGDAYLNWFSLLAAGARPGATHFLANGAVTPLGGVIGAGANGVLLQGLGDLNFNDNGFDAAVIGSNLNLNRSNNTGALGADWIAHLVQSIGTKPIGSALTATGKMRVGVDFTHADFDADKIAFALPAGARIYGNAYNTDTHSMPRFTVPNVDWIERSPNGFWGIAYNNTTALQVNDIQVLTVPTFFAYGGIRERSNPPPFSTTSCTTGDRTWDTNYEYRCVSTNLWKRAALQSW